LLPWVMSAIKGVYYVIRVCEWEHILIWGVIGDLILAREAAIRDIEGMRAKVVLVWEKRYKIHEKLP
jgi:hypothetical protein